MAFDVLVRALFTDNGLSAGLAQANASLHELGKSGPGAQRGLRLAETGMRALAFEAVGIQGPIGRVAEGLLQLGGGSALVLGAVAGIGAIAAAWKLSSQAFDEATKGADELNQRWRDLVAKGKPVVALQNDLTKAIKEQSDAQEKLNRLRSTQPDLPGATIGTAGEIAAQESKVAAAARITDAAREQLRRAQIELEAEASTRGQKFAQRFVEGIALLDPASRIAALFAAQPQFAEGGKQAGQAFAKAMNQAIEDQAFEASQRASRAAARAFDFGRGPRAAKLGAGEGGGAFLDLSEKPAFKPEPRVFFISDLVKEGGKPPPEKQDIAAISAASLAVLGAMQQGSAGGVLSSVGGLLSSIKGIPSPIGIGLTAFGGLFSLFDNSAERRHKEEMAALEELHRIRENTEHRGLPDHMSVTLLVNGKEISGAIIQDIAYGLQRMARTNGAPILPPS